MKTNNLLTVNNLQTHFFTAEGIIRAVDGVSFSLQQGEALGIVGESGSGKSVMSLSLMRLISFPPGKIVGGEIIFDGQDLRHLSEAAMRQIRGKRMAMIFQDPMTSLNPFLSVKRQLTEIIELHERATARAARQRAIELLEMVGIADAARRIDDYPHQFSGGMRQRVMIAMALACQPELLIADEPTTALDVTIQAQILALIKELREKMGTAVILITHDLGVVAGLADKIAVMYAGKMVEMAAVETLFHAPGHPYTQGLLQSVPDPASARETLFQIPGAPPNLAQLPPGCAFAPRCPVATAKCQTPPELVTLGAQHWTACWHARPLGTTID